jgi:hypothetical protein
MHYICNGHPFVSLKVSSKTYEYIAIWNWTNITFNNGHQATLSQPLEQMVTPYLWIKLCIFQLLIWTHQPWIVLTNNLCMTHGMMGVCSRFKT